MAITTDFDFICAKVRGMRSKLYEREGLARLSAKKRLQDLFTAVLPGETFTNHLQFERNLVADHLETLDGIRQFLEGTNHDFFSWLLRRYQVENAKVLLRGWTAREKAEAVRQHVVQTPPEYALPYEEMMAAEDIRTFLSLLPEKGLAKGAAKGIFYFNEKGKGFYVEAGLDQAYFATLAEKSSRLGHFHRPGVERLIATEIAIYNLIFVLRAKLNYALPWDTVREFIVLHKGVLNEAALETMYSLGALGEMLKHVPKAMLPQEEGQTLDDVSDIENALWRAMYWKANRQFYRSILDMGEIVSFCYIKRIELLNLIKITEAIRYGLSAQEMEQNLVTLAG
jgi:vacuolar-type H+-ATPase subunit C/Vma6